MQLCQNSLMSSEKTTAHFHFLLNSRNFSWGCCIKSEFLCRINWTLNLRSEHFRQQKIKYGAVQGGSTAAFFRVRKHFTKTSVDKLHCYHLAFYDFRFLFRVIIYSRFFISNVNGNILNMNCNFRSMGQFYR